MVESAYIGLYIFSLRSALGILCSTGSGRFSVDSHSRSYSVASNRLRRRCCSAFHRAGYSDRCCTSSVWLHCSTSSRNIGSTLITHPTTCYWISACRRRWLRLSLTVSMRIKFFLLTRNVVVAFAPLWRHWRWFICADSENESPIL